MKQIKLLADERLAESLTDMMMDDGVLSCTIEDADADSLDERPLYGEPGLEPENCAWPRSIVTLLIEDDFDVDTPIRIAASAMKIDVPEVLSVEAVDENTDWVRVTQAQFPPTQVSERLWIVPTWHDVPNENAVNLRLDPGVAFGTGSHPTTHLCLEWLDQNVTKDDTVLDYGCGTGILGIAAKLLGAKDVQGTDIDPLAVEAAKLNAQTNNAPSAFYLPNDLPAGHFSIVVANILCNPLKLLAPALIERMAPQGKLVLSGILAHQTEDIIAHYQALDPQLKLTLWKQEEDWVCIAGERQA